MYKYLLCGTCKIATACHQPYPLPQATSRPLQCCSFFFPIQNSCFPLIPLNQGQHLYSTLHLHSPSCLDFLPLSGEPGIPDLSAARAPAAMRCNLAARSPAPVGAGRANPSRAQRRACWRAGSSWKAKQAPTRGGTRRPAGWLTATNQPRGMGGEGETSVRVNFAAGDLGSCSFLPVCGWYRSQPPFSVARGT